MPNPIYVRKNVIRCFAKEVDVNELVNVAIAHPECDTLEVANLRNINDFDKLSGLSKSKITKLLIVDCNMTNINFVTSIVNLSFLSVSNNDIDDISPVAALKHLRILRASNNLITDVSVLRGSKIHTLLLRSNRIKHMGQINLANLKHLDIRSNDINDIQLFDSKLLYRLLICNTGVDITNGYYPNMSFLAQTGSNEQVLKNKYEVSRIAPKLKFAHISDQLCPVSVPKECKLTVYPMQTECHTSW